MRSFKPRYNGPGGMSSTKNHYIEDEVSGAYITLSPDKSLIITMPMVSEDNDYFCNERLLMHMVTEALELLQGCRADKEIQARKEEERTTTLSAAD